MRTVISISAIPSYSGGVMDTSDYPSIDACGLVVFYGNHVLLVKQKELWGLPNVECKKHEQYRNTAIRGTEEKTGLSKLYFDITRSLFSTQHISEYEDVAHIKTTHWFLAKFIGPQDHVFYPDISTGINEIEWVSLNDIQVYMNSMKSYARYMLELTLSLLKVEQDKVRNEYGKNI